jgi:hypothetical protein
MRPLVIDETVKHEIARVKKFAEEHRQSTDDLKANVNGTAKPVGDDPGHALMIPVGFRVVYSIEQQPEVGWVHHFSVSAPDPGRAISINGMRLILDEFGLKGRQYDHVYTENIGPNHIAVNVLIREEG